MPELDGIRGIAVSLVVLHHWTSTGFSMGLGNIGVQLFFVLSGFLITGILLRQRDLLDSRSTRLRSVFLRFWQSRIARILPVVMVTLVAVYIAGDRFEKREDMAWHFGFASNLLFFKRGEFASGLAHFWTLAVEQQFYLVWPFVILLVPRRHLEATIVGLVVLAPIARALLYAQGLTEFAQFNVLPISNFDSLGCGALVALWAHSPWGAARLRVLTPLGVLCAIGLAVNRWLGPLPANMEQTMYAVTFAWMISEARTGLPGVAGRFLESRAIIGLGMISYGVYAYHVFAPRAVGAGCDGSGRPRISRRVLLCSRFRPR
jgi:peptidoglycan/LPS O-acetylase OafA/YrhL